MSGYSAMSFFAIEIAGSSWSCTQKIISSIDLGYFCKKDDLRHVSNSGSMPFNGLKMVTPSHAEDSDSDNDLDLDFLVNLNRMVKKPLYATAMTIKYQTKNKSANRNTVQDGSVEVVVSMKV
ncbi:hypothetical protein OGAPHI_004102 [Ogataea philodendri]|uniref:Uncharacterized protein n=1 Tax=Ogataea philodendri TaxID=1378263 RepID=A0A9P8T4G2_9ASCO|nr:uncharacterized protein OGAPHI_004102 [Ogataea philodendri]KAH3665913.1 hypothetical protein OGAPHI_004102 [Ogataea philodendri]